MLTYPLEKRGKTPIYRYLYQCIRDDIIAGNLAKGTKFLQGISTKLKRQRHHHTNAYEELQIEGYITSVERRGFFVRMTNLASPLFPSSGINQIKITH